MRYPLTKSLFVFVVSLLLWGCSGSKEEVETGESSNEIDALAAAQEHYKANPEFFTFASIDDLPTDIEWENNHHLPEFASPDAKRGGTMKYFITDFPKTLRIIGPDSANGFRRYMLDDNGMRVVHPHPDLHGEYIPGLAEAWHIDLPNKRVYLKLDKDARYSDGVKITADDYFFMFYFMQAGHHKEPWSTSWYEIGAHYTNITKYDDYTISIDVPEAKPDIFRLFEEDVRPVPSHHYVNYGEDFTRRYQWDFEPTAGPYIVKPEDLEKGESISLTRVDDWWANDKRFWRNRFNPDRWEFKVVRDPPKAFELFKNGYIDFHGLSLPEYWHLKLPDDDPQVAKGYIHKYWFYNDRPRPTWAIWLNKSKPLLDDKNIRQGISYALNIDRAVDQFFRGDYDRMHTYASGFGEFSNPNVRGREFSVEKALEKFAAAGYTKRGSDGILVNDNGEKLSFRFTTGYKRLSGIMLILGEEAKRAGLDLRIDVMEATAAYKLTQEKKHEITLSAFSTGVELYPRYYDFFHSFNAYKEDGSPKPTTNNLTVTAYPEWDELIETYRKSTDLEEIKEISWKMQELIHEDAAYNPLWKRNFYRVGLWRWIRFPEHFDVKETDSWDQFNLAWIDEQERERTLEAMKKGETFEPVIKTFDQHKK